MDYRNILFSVEAGVARLTLNRPDKLNSFTGEMHAELRHALDTIQADASVRVLVLSGAGRAFCAGQDLADPDMAAQPDGRLPDIGNVVERNYKPLVLRLQNLRVPTIAAVNGIAAGAGASVALACDLVLAARSASFLQAFSKIGLVPDTGGTWFLPQRVGMARAMGLAMLADKLPAEKAADWGLINSAVPADRLDATVAELAGRIGQFSGDTLAIGKRAFYDQIDRTEPGAYAAMTEVMAENAMTCDAQEGMSAFLEKRQPVWPD